MSLPFLTGKDRNSFISVQAKGERKGAHLYKPSKAKTV